MYLLSRFKTSSDHRLVRATFKYNLHGKRSKIVRKHLLKYNKAAFFTLQKDYRLALQDRFEELEEDDLDVDSLNKNLSNVIVQTTELHVNRN